jgi:hypothetical protein
LYIQLPIHNPNEPLDVSPVISSTQQDPRSPSRAATCHHSHALHACKTTLLLECSTLARHSNEVHARYALMLGPELLPLPATERLNHSQQDPVRRQCVDLVHSQHTCAPSPVTHKWAKLCLSTPVQQPLVAPCAQIPGLHRPQLQQQQQDKPPPMPSARPPGPFSPGQRTHPAQGHQGPARRGAPGQPSTALHHCPRLREQAGPPHAAASCGCQGRAPRASQLHHVVVRQRAHHIQRVVGPHRHHCLALRVLVDLQDLMARGGVGEGEGGVGRVCCTGG